MIGGFFQQHAIPSLSVPEQHALLYSSRHWPANLVYRATSKPHPHLIGIKKLVRWYNSKLSGFDTFGSATS
jgi:hypothetical protein